MTKLSYQPTPPIARKVISTLLSAKAGNMVDLAAWRQRVAEAKRLGETSSRLGPEAGQLSSAFAAYPIVTNWVMGFVEIVQELPELARLVNRVQKSEEEYMPMKEWVRDPHAGGVKIPPLVQERTRRRLLAHAEKHYAGRYTRLDIRFSGVFCYLDAFITPTDDTPLHLCRLRHFTEDRWSLAFYTCSHEKYEPSFFGSGEFRLAELPQFAHGKYFLGRGDPGRP